MTGRVLLPSRSEYLAGQKTVPGRKLVGVFPAVYPKELLWALDVLPVEIWDPKLEYKYSGAHLQGYICTLARLGLELVLQGRCSDLEGFLFPHTCDTLQNLASVVHDYIGIDKPCWFFYVPKAPYGPASRGYYVDRLKLLARQLSERFGELDPARLEEAVEKSRQVSDLLGALYSRRAAGVLSLGAGAFYEVIRAGEYMHPDDFIPLLERTLEMPGQQTSGKPAVVLSGVLPNPVELLAHIEQSGLRIGFDDFYSCARRLLPASPGSGDPFETLAERFFSLPPCSTRGSPLGERVCHLDAIIKSSGARGVIFSIVKFCEAEFFDVPRLVDELNKKGIPTLVLETELNSGLTGQMRTRVEAFAELVEMGVP